MAASPTGEAGVNVEEIAKAKEAQEVLVDGSTTKRQVAGREVLLACPALRTTLSPVDVAAELLRKMRQQAEAALGSEIGGAVVTVPAYFGEAEREGKSWVSEEFASMFDEIGRAHV